MRAADMDGLTHRLRFREFSVLELSTGGPDPQVEVAARAARTCSEPAWLVGCFVGPYTCGAAAAIFAHWPSAVSVLRENDLLASWLIEHWAGIPVRRERRAVWKAEKLAACLQSYARWSLRTLPSLAGASYDELYESMEREVWGFGRYAIMKTLETLHRANCVDASQTDIRPSGARFPRKTLGYMYGEHNYGGNSVALLREANQLATRARDLLGESWFNTETLLCNYRQSLDGKYPGRSHDRELKHWLRAQAYWDDKADLQEVLPFYELRAESFPTACLGEVRGDLGDRMDLEAVLDEHDYYWCDTRYDYALSRGRLAYPVEAS